MACLMSKSVIVFSLHPDYLAVFDKMTQEQDKLKCYNRMLTCRDYWCFKINKSTKLSVLNKYFEFATCLCLCSLEFCINLKVHVRSDILLLNEMSKFGLCLIYSTSTNILTWLLKTFRTNFFIVYSEMFSLYPGFFWKLWDLTKRL